ncbi:MAG: hypothetical protein LBC62_04780 [Treponema sp.]|nr:hypothetical protein [Treponema sp.]
MELINLLCRNRGKSRDKTFAETNRVLGKALSFAFFLFFFTARFSFLSAQQNQQPWWFALEQGKLYYRSGAYGNALMAFEDARRNREARFTRMEQDLVQFLSLPDVRRLGDSLDRVETYIAERGQTQAAAALAELYYRVPKQSLGGSAAKALEELDRLKAYPEAEFWLGETYSAEGELGLALGQYRKAYSGRDLLETPGFDAEILYKMAGIHRMRQEYQEMEKTLLEIITGQGPEGEKRDSLWAGGNGGYARAAMARVLENDGISRFLTLYRYDNAQVERAHRLLGFFYYASNRTPAAEHLMFSFLIQNTVLIGEVLRKEYDYTFSTLDALMDAVQRRQDLLAYIEETEYFKTLYYLGSSLFASGKLLPARQFWTFLAGRIEAGEWRVRAQGQLRSPYVDKAIEMP